MQTEYYITPYRYKNQTRYFIYFYTDETEGLVTINNRVLSFSSTEELKNYTHQQSIALEEENSDSPLDLDHILSWINRKSNTFDLKIALDSWNLFTDISNSTKINFKGCNRSRLIDLIYDKIFYGNNLPAITPEGKEYTPIWNRHQLKKIREIFLHGFELFTRQIIRYEDIV